MVAIFVLAISAAALVTGVAMMAASRKARSWPVVAGQVVERGVGPATTTGASRAGRYFEPRVTYTYEVAGKAFRGHRIGLAPDAFDEDKAKRVADALPAQVEVHYNPDDPSDAVLEPSSIAMSILILLVGVIGGLAGAAMLLMKK
jgi:hypothetical protein